MIPTARTIAARLGVAADRSGLDMAARICGCEYVYLLTPKGWKWKAAGVGNRWRVLRAAVVTA